MARETTAKPDSISLAWLELLWDGRHVGFMGGCFALSVLISMLSPSLIPFPDEVRWGQVGDIVSGYVVPCYVAMHSAVFGIMCDARGRRPQVGQS